MGWDRGCQAACSCTANTTGPSLDICCLLGRCRQKSKVHQRKGCCRCSWQHPRTAPRAAVPCCCPCTANTTDPCAHTFCPRDTTLCWSKARQHKGCCRRSCWHPRTAPKAEGARGCCSARTTCSPGHMCCRLGKTLYWSKVGQHMVCDHCSCWHPRTGPTAPGCCGRHCHFPCPLCWVCCCCRCSGTCRLLACSARSWRHTCMHIMD